MFDAFVGQKRNIKHEKARIQQYCHLAALGKRHRGMAAVRSTCTALRECIAQGRSIGASGGLVTFVDQSFQHEIVLNVIMHTLWEGLTLQIKGGGLPKGLIIWNIYRPPRMLKVEIKQFINEFALLILSLEKYKLNNSWIL